MKKKDIQNVLNLCEFARRFEELRCEGRSTISYKDVSQGIEERTGVYISHTQLSKYAKMGVQEEVTRGVSARNAIAIALYFNVSVEYLLGLSNSRSYDKTDKLAADKFGLTDKSMELLRTITRRISIFYWNDKSFRIGNSFVSPELINFIFENEDFWSKFDPLLSTYINRKQKSESMEAELKTEKQIANEIDNIAAARYSLIRLFEMLIDDIASSCQFLPPDVGHERSQKFYRGKSAHY